MRLRVWFNDGVNGSQLLTPDQRIAAVGYAMVASTLQSGATISSSTAAPAASIANSTDNPAALKLSTSFRSWWLGQNRAPDAIASFDEFFIYDQNANATRLRIDTNGVIHGNGSGLTGVAASGLAPGATIPASQVATPPPGMALIPAGPFTMGDSLDGLSDAVPISTTVSAFYMDVNEVTLSQWQSVYYWATSNGYSFAVGAGKGPNHPVHMVSWYDVVKWCNARSEQAGKTPVYYTDDAQTTIYKTGNVDVTNAQVKWTANGYGLYDMAGNVYEWCWDWYGTPYAGGTDPHGAATGSYRVLRGGGWFLYAYIARCANRVNIYPTYAGSFVGFRAVLPPGQ